MGDGGGGVGGGSSLEPGMISGKDILEVIGQLSDPLQKVLRVLECGNSQYVSMKSIYLHTYISCYMNSQCELSYYHSVKVFGGVFKLSRKLN